MKFNFSYEPLLEHRKLQEEIARRDFYEALTALNEQKDLYKRLYTRLHDAERESNELRSSLGSDSISRLQELDYFMEGQKTRISRQREVVINHTSIMEGKQELLINAAKETKVLEKLKEKKLSEFKKVQAKKEMKRTDEVVVTRFKSQRQGGT